jgi:hypothetical protein
MRHMTNRHIVTMEGGAELHTRKGWRGASRSSGTNRRRKLTEAGYASAPLSRANRLSQTKTQKRTFWGKLRNRYLDWLDQRAAARIKMQAEEAALAAAAAAEIAKAKGNG